MNKEKLFDIIDDLLQDCANETIDCEDIKENITDDELQLIYDNVKLFTLKLKDRIEDEWNYEN